jgi:hypothetical protein
MKRIIAMLLCCTIVVCARPVNAFAATAVQPAAEAVSSGEEEQTSVVVKESIKERRHEKALAREWWGGYAWGWLSSVVIAPIVIGIIVAVIGAVAG